MKNLILTLAAIASSSFHSDLPVGADLFIPAALDTPMSIEASNYKFSVQNFDSDTLVSAYSKSKKTIEHKISGAGLNDIERLFVLESHACDIDSIDLLLQLGPGNNSDTSKRRYYRIVYSKDLSTVVSEFYDPSIPAVNAVLPIQTVQGIPDPSTGSAITCDGSTPTITHIDQSTSTPIKSQEKD